MADNGWIGDLWTKAARTAKNKPDLMEAVAGPVSGGLYEAFRTMGDELVRAGAPEDMRESILFDVAITVLVRQVQRMIFSEGGSSNARMNEIGNALRGTIIDQVQAIMVNNMKNVRLIICDERKEGSDAK